MTASLALLLPRWNDVAHPLGYHINAFYSCETMTTSDADRMNYQNGKNGDQWIDAGRAGFRVVVYAYMLDNNVIDPTTGKPGKTNHTLDEHAKEFFDSLNKGYTLNEARRRANRLIFNSADDPNGYATSSYMLLSPTPSKVYSDPLATFRYVYLHQGERSNPTLPDTNWFHPQP